METLNPHILTSGIAIALDARMFLLVFFLIAFAFAIAQRWRRLTVEKWMAESQRRLALISSMRGSGFWSWDARSDRIWANNHARGALGLREETPLIREALLGAIHPEDRDRVVRAIRAAVSRGGTAEMELRVVGPDDEVRWIIAKMCAYRDVKGVVRRVEGCVVDDSQRRLAVTEARKLQQILTQMTRTGLLGELSGALAHELLQPLTAIMCNAQAARLLAEKTPFNAAELREMLADIISADEHAGQIIQRLRALMLRKETQLQRVELRDVFRDVQSLTRTALMEHNVQLDARVDDDLPVIQGDRIELQQVLLNLVLNACQSMSENPARDRRLEIVAALDANHTAVHTSVLDRGTGIDPKQLERVFDPFFSTKSNGLGLGLSICHLIIAAHGGRLWATNRIDRGAAFHFTLPVAMRETQS